VIVFQDNFFSRAWMYEGNNIIGGDLNFLLGSLDILGPLAHVDPLTYYFMRKFDDLGLYDIELIKIKPTWRNKRVGDDRIEKRLDIFLISESLVSNSIRLR
jgi:hypothetical protein